MATSSSTRPRSTYRSSVGAIALALSVSAVVSTGVASASRSVDTRFPTQAADPCPAAYPTRDLVAEQAVNGLTVETGRTPDPFEATIVGVIRNGIAPGVDMIIAEATSPAITSAGGIWAGMSGSPVYADDGRLVGAVAYGLSFGPSPIAGITPAAAMRTLLDGGGLTTASPVVDLPAAIEDRLVESGAATRSETASGMAALPTPVGVSGVNPGRMDDVADRIERHMDNVQVYASGTATGRAAVNPLVPGGNVAVALSYGDFTAGGVGTVTAVCDGEALLFGHPATFAGSTVLSAHQASAVYVQPETVGAPFKVANFGGVAGTVDEDRLVGLHAVIGETPSTTRVRSVLSDTSTGASRTAITHVVNPDFVPDGAAVHTWRNLDRVHDRIGAGVSTLVWSASGTRHDGSTWRLTRREKLADQIDATTPQAFRMFDHLSSLYRNPFEQVTIDAVNVTGAITPTYTDVTIVGLQVRDPAGRWRNVDASTPVRIVAGTDAALRAVVRPYRGSTTRTIPVTVAVPRRWTGAAGELLVVGGGDFFDESTAGSFDQLLAKVRRAPTGDTVIATLNLFRDGPGGFESVRTTGRATAGSVVFGSRLATVQVVAPIG